MATIQAKQVALKDGRMATVRAAEESDAAQTLEIFNGVVAETRFTLALPDETEKTLEAEQHHIAEFAESPGKLWVVTEVEGEILGMASVEAGERRVESHFGEIGDVYVKANSRNLGIGTLTMKALIQWAKAHPVLEKLGLYVFSSSTAAVQMYTNLGFEIEGRGVRDMKFGPDDYVDTIIMGMWLSDNQPASE